MFDFYRKNVGFYLELAFYKLFPYFVLAVFCFGILSAGIIILAKFNVFQFSNVVAAITGGLFLLVLIGIPLIFVGKFLYITGYSLCKEWDDSRMLERVIYKMTSKFFSLKFFTFLNWVIF